MAVLGRGSMKDRKKVRAPYKCSNDNPTTEYRGDSVHNLDFTSRRKNCELLWTQNMRI